MGGNVNKFVFILSIFILGLSGISCTKNLDNYGPQVSDGDIPILTSNRTVVLNEGNFMFGNGSVSLLDNENGTMANNVYSSVNGIPLGDVPQSLVFHDSMGYIVVNNSNKIELVDQRDFSSFGSIKGFNSPRYLSIKSTSPLRGYVSDLYANKIWIVNLESRQIEGEIPFNGWGEEMLNVGQHTWILNKTDSLIYKIKHQNDELGEVLNGVDRVFQLRPWGPNQLVILTATGIFTCDNNGENLTLKVDVNGLNATKMATNFSNGTVYFLNPDVHSIDLATKKSQIIFSQPPGGGFYNLAFDELRNRLLVLDAKDYVQRGDLIILNESEEVVEKHQVGINPQFVTFD